MTSDSEADREDAEKYRRLQAEDLLIEAGLQPVLQDDGTMGWVPGTQDDSTKTPGAAREFTETDLLEMQDDAIAAISRLEVEGRDPSEVKEALAVVTEALRKAREVERPKSADESGPVDDEG